MVSGENIGEVEEVEQNVRNEEPTIVDVVEENIAQTSKQMEKEQVAVVQMEEDSVSDRNQSTSCLGNKQSSEKNQDLEC